MTRHGLALLIALGLLATAGVAAAAPPALESCRDSGGPVAFTRCVARAVRAPAPKFAPKPAPVDIHACRVDRDCTLHFRVSACVPGHPVAVNTLDPAKVRATYPVERHACGMGGPQYDELRQSNENRYSARCERARCVAHDAGPQPTHRDRLGL